MKLADLSADQRLVRAAICCDLQALDNSKLPGAVHFSAVMKLHPRHLEPEKWAARSEAVESDDSVLFFAGELFRLVITGSRDTALEMFKTESGRHGAKDAYTQLFVQSIGLWLKPSADDASSLEQVLQNVQSDVDQDTRARIQLQIACRVLESAGVRSAGKSYDLALALARGDLKRAIATVGLDFGRDRFIYFAPLKARLVRYDDILDLVGTTSVDSLRDMAQRQFKSPFTRTFGGVKLAVPREIISAQLRAEWAGAFWVQKQVNIAAASFSLLNSSRREDRMAAIVSWIIGGGGDVKRLLNANEQVFDENSVREFYAVHMLQGARVSESLWLDICTQLWDVFPFDIAKNLIRSMPLSLREIQAGGDGAVTSLHPDQPAIEIFARLLAFDPSEWMDRFLNLSGDVQAAVCRRLEPVDASQISRAHVWPLVRALMDACKSTKVRDEVSTVSVFMCLAELASKFSLDSEELKNFILSNQTEQASAIVALNYAEFSNRPMVESHLQATLDRLRSEIASNANGQWSSFGSSSAAEIAQAALALGHVSIETQNVLESVLASQFASSDDIIDACQAFVWLLDENVAGVRSPAGDLLRNRRDISEVDRHWSGRDDLRAMNAALAGVRLRVGSTSPDDMQELAFAVRDPDVQVRLLALRQFETDRVGLFEPISSVLDSVLVGAIFDPDSRVVATAARVVRHIHQAELYELAWARISSQYSSSHLRVRFAAAAAVLVARRLGRWNANSERVLYAASRDPSVRVRQLVARIG